MHQNLTPQDTQSPAVTPAPVITRRRLVMAGGIAVTALGGGAAATLWALHQPGRGNDDALTQQPGLGGSRIPQRHLSFGWLPAGYASVEFMLGSQWESLSAANSQGIRSLLRAGAYRAGLTPPADLWQPPDAEWTTGSGQHLVNSHPTRYVTAPDSDATRARIQWQYATNSWAQVDYRSSEADALATAHHIATSLHMDTATPVHLPVTASGLPTALRLQSVDGYDPGGNAPWLYGLSYAPTPRPLTNPTDYPQLFLRVGPMTPGEQVLASNPDLGANTSIQGHPARRTQNPPEDGPGELLELWNVNGCKLTISIQGQTIIDLIGPHGAL
jgi:hypothetical protein